MTWDAVVVGAGPNGLVAANHLVDHGWSVLLVEEQSEPGGAVRSDRDVHPEFVHDTFSSFYPLAAASPTIQSFALEEHGLVWRHAPAVLGHPQPGGRWALLHRDRELTAKYADEQHAGYFVPTAYHARALSSKGPGGEPSSRQYSWRKSSRASGGSPAA